MPRPLRIEISESEDTLKRLLRQQTSGRCKERLQVLYWLKSGQATTRLELARLTGRGESTVYRWLKLYKAGGLQTMLEIPTSPGKPPMIGGEDLEKLKARLAEPRGFESYGAIQQWLSDECGLEVPYKTVHQTVHYRLQVKLKVPRPRWSPTGLCPTDSKQRPSRQMDEAQQQAYKKNCPE